MIRQKQVITDYRDAEAFGGADCPYCGKRNTLEARGEGKFRWLVVSEDRCLHADMAVDAGFPEVAIHFLSNRGFA